MSSWLDILLEIVRTTVPALVVFLTVYFLMKQFFKSRLDRQAFELRQQNQRDALPLKMQAYERLSLFCERITLPNLLLRTQQQGRTVSEFRLALLLSIQQEYEHNVTQQVYVSEKLWEIIKLARDFTMDMVSSVAEQLEGRADGRVLADAIIRKLAEQEGDPLQQAQLAIKKEAALYLG